MSWRYAKVSTKIIIFSMIPLILIGIIGIWAFNSSKNVFNNVSHLKDESLVFANLAHRMGKDVIHIQQWLTDISATRGLDGLNDGFDEAEESYQSFLSGLNRFEQMYEKENDKARIKKTRDLRSSIDSYYEMGKKMANGYIEGGPDVGNKIMADFDKAAEKLSTLLNPFVEEQLKEEEEMAENTIKSVNKLKTVVLIICIISLAITILSSMFLINTIKVPLNAAMNFAHALAAGDLTKQVDLKMKDEFGLMLTAMNSMAVNLKNMAGQITGVSGTVASSSEELSATTTQITSGINEQAQQLEQSAAATTEVSQTIVDVARNATEASDVAKGSVEIANEGKSVVKQTVTSMLNIAQNVEKSSYNIGELGESSKQIGEIINVINDIAGQTNLLALNAAIEAARAGEQGRGFAVVADEVRKLAEKTSNATDEITEMIKKIQNEAKTSVESMEQNKVEAEGGVKLAEQAQASLDNIVQASDKCFDMVSSIAASTEQQSSAVEEVSANIENVSNFFGTSREAISQINISTNDLAKTSTELMNLVSWFKIEDNSGNTAIKDKYKELSSNEDYSSDKGTSA